MKTFFLNFLVFIFVLPSSGFTENNINLYEKLDSFGDVFDLIQKNMRDDVLFVLAHRRGKHVAAALNFIGRDTLFGRYWGCNEEHSCLHYELCYYQAIDYALSQQLKKVEAGAQGEHKLARGYMPAITNSMHWFLDKKFHSAVEKYLNEERAIIHDQYNNILIDGPFKK